MASLLARGLFPSVRNQSFRRIFPRFLGFDVTPDTEIRLLKDPHDWSAGETLRFSEAKLRENEKNNKILVQIISHKWKSIPLFKLMTHNELDSLLHKARKDRSDIRYITEKQGRIKEKIKHFSPTSSEQEVEYAFKQVTKWVRHGHHVNIHISDKNPEFTARIQARLNDLMSEPETIGTIQHKIDHKKGH